MSGHTQLIRKVLNMWSNRISDGGLQIAHFTSIKGPCNMHIFYVFYIGIQLMFYVFLLFIYWRLANLS